MQNWIAIETKKNKGTTTQMKAKKNHCQLVFFVFVLYFNFTFYFWFLVNLFYKSFRFSKKHHYSNENEIECLLHIIIANLFYKVIYQPDCKYAYLYVEYIYVVYMYATAILNIRQRQYNVFCSFFLSFLSIQFGYFIKYWTLK